MKLRFTIHAVKGSASLACLFSDKKPVSLLCSFSPGQTSDIVLRIYYLLFSLELFLFFT